MTDFNFGQGSKLLYSTASILFAGTIGERDLILFYGDPTEGVEFAIGDSVISFPPGSLNARTLTPVHKPKTATDPLLIYADTDIASSYFAPVVQGTGPLGSFWQFGSNTTILVGGPNLVRNATISADGTALALRGDLNASTPLMLFVPTTVTAVTWNGQNVAVRAVPDVTGLLMGQLEYTLDPSSIKIPSLTEWKFKDSLPEIQAGFDDSKWTVADHKTTNITQKPLFGDGRVLYGKQVAG